MKHERQSIRPSTDSKVVFSVERKYLPTEPGISYYSADFSLPRSFPLSFLFLLKKLQREPAWNQVDRAARPQYRSFSLSSVTAFASSADRRVKHSADFSSTASNHERLGRRAKEKLLDRVRFCFLLKFLVGF